MAMRIAWRRYWRLLFVLAFGVRLTAAFMLDGFRSPETFEYENLARSMLAGKGFVYKHLDVVYYSFAAPLYSWMCAAVYAAGGTVGTVLLLQMMLSASQAVLVARMAEELFQTTRAGMVAGFLVAVHPGLIVYASSKLHPLTVDAVVFSLALWLFWRLNATPSWTRAVVAGLVVGIGALTRSTVVVFLPIGALWSLWTHGRERWLTLVSRWVVAGLCAAMVIMPWSVRNTLIHGKFVWMLTTDSEVFWRGNNPAATGHSYVNGYSIELDTLTPNKRHDLLHQRNELTQAHWFLAEAIDFIRSNPTTFVRLTIMKFYRFWWFSSQSGLLYRHNWLVAYRAFYVLVLVLGALGIWSLVRQRDVRALAQVALLVLFLLALSALQSLYYVEVRHRWAVEPLLLVLAGGSGAWLSHRWQPERETAR